MLSDIQHTVNCRPLTYRCADDQSLEIITPNKFLYPSAECNVYLQNPKDVLSPSSSRGALLRSLRTRDKILDSFKTLWYEEYLLGMRGLFKDLHETPFVNKVKVNDIVLIKNPAKSRQHWHLGRVLQVYPGSDGQIRSVKLLRGDANYERGARRIELHSLKHLYPIELSITHPYVPLLSSEELASFNELTVEDDLDFSGETSLEDVSLLESGLDNDNLIASFQDQDSAAESLILDDPDENLLDYALFFKDTASNSVSSLEEFTCDEVASNEIVESLQASSSSEVSEEVLSSSQSNSVAVPSLSRESSTDPNFAAVLPSISSTRSRRIKKPTRAMDDEFVYYH